MRARVLSLIGSTLLLLPGLPAQTSHAAPAPAVGGPAAAVGDIDGDGRPETLIGLRRAVDVHLSSTGTRQRITLGWLGFPVLPNATFGAAFAVGDLNGDGYADLAIGSSGETERDASHAGALYIVYGSASGLSSARAQRLSGNTLGLGNLGASLAVVNTVEATFLAAGAPDNGGVVAFFRSGPSGLELATTFGEHQAEGSPPVTHSDGFGARLAADGDLLVVGSPYKIVAGHDTAGGVAVLRVTGSTPTVRGISITQNSAGIPGAAEPYDYFGEAVAIRDGMIAIGVPGEGLGGISPVGMVQLLGVAPSGTGVVVSPLSAYHQNSPGVPGTNETRDGFGVSVTLARGLTCAGELVVAIGVPGEDLGSAASAGSVTVLAPGKPECTRSFSQGTGGLGGARESGDLLGRTLGTLRDPAGGADALQIGAPEEDVNGYLNAGVAYTVRRTATGWSRVTYSGKARGQLLGWSLGGTCHLD